MSQDNDACEVCSYPNPLGGLSQPGDFSDPRLKVCEMCALHLEPKLAYALNIIRDDVYRFTTDLIE